MTKNFCCLVFLIIAVESYGMRALNTAATGMAAQETHVSTISHNIANLNTIGFKKQRADFDSLRYETVNQPGARSSGDTQYTVGLQIGNGAKVSAIKRNMEVGSPMITNNPFDLMIQGDGFFGIFLPNGQLRYTRDGAFNVDKAGFLTTKHGYKVFPSIQVPPNTAQINVSEAGKVEAYIRNQKEPIGLGSIPVFMFVNPVGLKAVGQNFYSETSVSGVAIQHAGGEENAGPILQGTLEASNVSIMSEMTGLIKAQRAYEMNSKVMKVADEMLQTVNSIR